jgi:hypothetical protein
MSVWVYYIDSSIFMVTGQCVPDLCVPKHSVWDFLSLVEKDSILVFIVNNPVACCF